MVDDNNPYRWIDLGDKEYASAKFHQALKFYRRAAKAAPYLHESYLGLARAHYQLGDMQQAEIDIQKALALSYVPEDKVLYQAKLLALGK